MKQQQIDHVLLISQAIWTKNFLNQPAMFIAMKSRAHYLISNYVQ